MNQVIAHFTVFFAGLLIGVFFFGGLWWTIKMGMRSKYPAIWFIASFVIRFGTSLTVFFLMVSDNRWERLLVCLAGFVIARIGVSRCLNLKNVKCFVNSKMS